MATFFAPVEGESIRSESSGADVGGFVNGRWQPSSRSRRSSLHDIRLKPTPVQEEPLPPTPVEAPLPYNYTDVPTQAATNFTQGDNAMAGNNRNATLDDLDNFDDLEGFDPFDVEQLGKFVQRQVQSALTPSHSARQEAEAVRQYNQCFERFGADPNFKETLDEVLQACVRDIQAGRPLNIEQRYEEASESVRTRPGKRLSHLPARTIRDLGKIIDHNNRSGRARPYRGR